MSGRHGLLFCFFLDSVPLVFTSSMGRSSRAPHGNHLHGYLLAIVLPTTVFPLKKLRIGLKWLATNLTFPSFILHLCVIMEGMMENIRTRTVSLEVTGIAFVNLRSIFLDGN